MRHNGDGRWKINSKPKHRYTVMPLASSFGIGSRPEYRRPAQEKIDEYIKSLYPGWLDNIREYLKKIPDKLEARYRTHSVNVYIENTGSRPADNITVEFETMGRVMFLVHDSAKITKKIEAIPEFPKPPSPPQGDWILPTRFKPHLYDVASTMGFKDTFAHISKIPSVGPNIDFSSLMPPKPRDRNSFYYKDRRPDRISFECEEFRHQVGAEEFKINLIIPKKSGTNSAAISSLITARNLPDPIKAMIHININYSKDDTKAKALELMDNELSGPWIRI